MTETSKNEQSEAAVDLSNLNDLNLGPAWGDTNLSLQQASKKSTGTKEFKKSVAGGGQLRERRPRSSTFKRDDSRSHDRRSNDRRGDDRRGDRRSHAPREAFFQPTVSIDFYPDDEPFKALSQAIRSSHRTYQLFEMAMLILEKNERFLAVIESKEKGAPIYCSAPDNFPFETEEQALAYVFKNHMDKFFNTEDIEIEPPKGSFPIINKCGITGMLIGPPNFHRYQQLLQDHYNNNVSNSSFERFTAKIEGVKEQEAVDQWMESMKKATKYTLKEVKEGEEPKSFDQFEEARAYLLANLKAKLVIARPNARFPGNQLEALPEGSIKKSLLHELEQQRRFPLQTANNLRGRLRRMKFNLYKKGSKGVTYVCAVKRKFREPGQTFSDSIQGLVDFIEKNPKNTVATLPQGYLGIAETASTEEEQAKSRQMMLDLTWLIDEGYVAEYGDGTLSAEPPRAAQPEKKAPESSASAPEEKPAETPVVEAVAPAPVASEEKPAAPAPESTAPEEVPAKEPEA